jgi:hypothetical protein
MLFREAITGYCESHTKHTSTLWGQNAGLCYVKVGDACSRPDSWAVFLP